MIPYRSTEFRLESMGKPGEAGLASWSGTGPLSGIVLAADGPVVCGVCPLVLRALGK
ncbi:MAG: hypothetical protein AAB177_04600 [Nitrospirota bacterium]